MRGINTFMSNSDLDDIKGAIRIIKRYCAITDMKRRADILRVLELASSDAVALLGRLAERDNAAPKDKSTDKPKNAETSQPSSFREPSQFSKPEKPSTPKKRFKPIEPIRPLKPIKPL
jgi:hypothetical protein